MSLAVDQAEPDRARSVSPARSGTFWNISQKLKRKVSFDSDSTRHAEDGHTTEPGRASIEVPNHHGANISSLWFRKAHRPLITIPEDCPARPPRKDSGYYSAELKPETFLPGSGSDRQSLEQVTIPRFSWQSSTDRSTPSTSRPRHVEIVIPSYAQPVIDPLESGNSVISNFPELLAVFPQPPSLPPTPPPRRPPPQHRNSSTSTITPATIIAEPTVSTMDGDRRTSQPMLQLRDPSTTTFPSMSRPSLSRDTSYASVNSLAADGVSPPIPSVANVNNTFDRPFDMASSTYRTTGKEPPALVGASTTILGDKLYVVGGRQITGRTASFNHYVYELDLISRHWIQLEVQGDVPPPRYFHTVCTLGTSKLVCYGGLTPAPRDVHPDFRSTHEPDLAVLSDVSIFDVDTQMWTALPANNAPTARFAHCAAIVPSTSFFTSAMNTQDDLVGKGGAELIIAGGQDNKSKYINEISVFNLRSRRWTSTVPLAGDFGAYKSVLATMPGLTAEQVGFRASSRPATSSSPIPTSTQAPLLFYSNYHFVDVRIDLKVGNPPAALKDIPVRGQHLPPGIRFPTCGIIADHLIVSGTVVNSTSQEYAIWALNLKTLQWSRVDASDLTRGSWSKGILWPKRNIYVVLGHKGRKQGKDYQIRRMNFHHICMIELEAFGLYENLQTRLSPITIPQSITDTSRRNSMEMAYPGFSTAESLGGSAMGVREIADMEIMALGGERIPVNSTFLVGRWGPYFLELLEESANAVANLANSNEKRPQSQAVSEATLRPNFATRLSTNTITPIDKSSARASLRTNRTSQSSATLADSAVGSISDGVASKHASLISNASPGSTRNLPSRILYLPHTVLTIRALLFFLHTLTLPPPTSSLCASGPLTSLLAIARTYRIPGLLEATLHRLHQTLNAKSAADVFNAAALAAGDGSNVTFAGFRNEAAEATRARLRRLEELTANAPVRRPAGASADGTRRTVAPQASFESTASSASESSAATDTSEESGTTEASDSSDASGSSRAGAGVRGDDGERKIWTGEVSPVIGIMKRGLRGVWEGKAMRNAREREMRDRAERGTGLGLGVEEGEAG